MEKEYDIKIVPTPAIVYYLGFILLTAFGIERFIEGKYLAGVLSVVIGTGFFFLRKTEPKKAKSVIRINAERLWVRNRGNKPWSTILCIKFRYEGRDQVYLDLYWSNEIVADEEIDLRGINMSTWRLKRILKRYTRVENH